jgi:hypothetical protein
VSSTHLQKKKQYKPAQLLAALLLVHGLVISLALTITVMLMRLEFFTLFSLVNTILYYSSYYMYQLCNFYFNALTFLE